MKNGKFDLKTFLNNVELYMSTILFISLTILLFSNVVSRYVFSRSFAWIEEVATIAFVWMIWFAMSAAVTKRKHLRIDFILEIVPFNVKRIMLIISNIIFAGFNVYLLYVVMTIINRLALSRTTLLRLPQQMVYSIIPIGLVLSIIRIGQDTVRLLHEDKSNLGVSKPAMDLEECRRIYLEKKAAKEEQSKGGNN
jgi:TRAP-type C4-dicarboxylate transport system permease small subunit